MTAVDIPDMVYALALAIILIFVVKYISAVFQARARAANDERYRALAEKAAAAQSEAQATMAAVQADLAKIALSLATVEKILQQV